MYFCIKIYLDGARASEKQLNIEYSDIGWPSLTWNFAWKPVQCSANSFYGHRYEPKTKCFQGYITAGATASLFVVITRLHVAVLLLPLIMPVSLSPLLSSINVAKASSLALLSLFFLGQSQPLGGYS